MKAKPTEQLLLLKLQEHDLTLQNLKKQLVNLDAHQELQAAKQELLEVRSRAASSQHEVDDVRLQIEKLQDDVRLVGERLERDHNLLSQNLSVREAQGIEAEIEQLVTRKNVLEDSQLELMQTLEDIESIHEDIVEQEHAIQSKIDGFDETIAENRQRISEQIQQEQGERRIVTAQIAPELVELYENRRDRYGIGASKLSGRYSQAVGVELSRDDMVQISQTPADEVVFCPISQAILVRAE